MSERLISRRDILTGSLGASALLGTQEAYNRLWLPEVMKVQGAVIAERETGLTWIIDTGSTITVIPEQVAIDCGLQVKGYMRILGITNTAQDVPFGNLKQVWGNGFSLQYNIDALVWNTDHIGERIGILGLNFLGNPSCLKR